MHRPLRTAACLLLLMLVPATAAADGLLLQFQGTLGTSDGPGRLYLFLDPDRVDPFDDNRSRDALRSGSHHNLVGLPLYQRGGYVPDVVYQAASTRAERRQGDLSRLCGDNPLACAVGSIALASRPLLDRHQAGRDASGFDRLAP